LNYDQVLAILEQNHLPAGDGVCDNGLPETLSSAVLERLFGLDELARKLAARRQSKGVLNFDKPQPEILLDSNGVPLEVRLLQKNRATSLVEECMIAANEAVATIMLEAGAAMIYRVHEQPSPDALLAILPTLREFGYATDTPPQTAAEIQRILDDSRQRPEADLIATVMLRAMKRARYYEHFTTHFGLASTAYTHFTSPIRRYPDLLAHRLLKFHLAGKEPPEQMLQMLPIICQGCSDAEQKAEKATQAALRMKLCEYFSTKIGQYFHGMVSSVNSYGFYVREDTTYVEGFVMSETMGRSYVYQPERQRWSTESGNKFFRQGQTGTVRLLAVDTQRNLISFSTPRNISQ
jgi:ribonuclease R